MAEKKNEIVEPEWSHMVEVEDLGDKPLKLTIEPNEAQRSRLIRRLGLLALDDCEARLTLSRGAGHIIHIVGEITAKARQNCVVTLEPVETKVQERFEAWYADPAQALSLTKARRDQEIRKGHGEMPALEERDDPEPVIDGRIDIGELVSQYLSLGIDPYPHAPGVEPQESEQEHQIVYEDPTAIKNPFAALKDWKDKLK